MSKFSPANVKIKALSKVQAIKKFLPSGKKVYSFDVLSGHSCPFANECASRVDIVDGKKKIKDGKNTLFRCFSASQEVIYTNVHNLRKANFDELKDLTQSEMVDRIQAAMPSDLGVCRIHVAGDFFNQVYFDAWVAIATKNPDKLFYAYTKSLPYWVNRLGSIPNNLILTASKGGRRDDMIEAYGLRSVQVVFSNYQAKKLKLKVDHTDECAANPEKKNVPFCLLIHGVQISGSTASAAISRMKKSGVQFAYSKKTEFAGAK